jgi:sialic acid synthase SpsE
MTIRFIAEVSSNHHGDLSRCLAFVDSAAQAGCSDVKFQLFRIRELFAPEAIRAKPELLAREAWELDPAFLAPISERCRARGVGFGCTPFYLEAVDQLAPHVDFFKVASYELLWDDLLAACAETGKPVIISTGMATMAEVAHAVEVLRSHGCASPTILHCVSGYPTPITECNLAAIATMREAFGCAIGWSDHSVSPSVLHRAIHHWGASTIEFHLDLDGTGDEFKTGHCWLPPDIGAVIRAIADGFIADGDGEKVPAATETTERGWRADPADGLRPTMAIRTRLRAATSHTGS